MDAINIYTDGGCSGNPGPGGWAFIICLNSVSQGVDKLKESGNELDTTNNRMELTAVIKALQKIHEIIQQKKVSANIDIVVHTDSQYVQNGINCWINRWVRNGWKTASGKGVKNKEYWVELKHVSEKLHIRWSWVKGHSGDTLNEECDAMVKKEMKKI